MSRVSRPLTAGLFLCGIVLCQPATTGSAFEAADVHVSAPGTTQSGGFLPNGRLEFQAFSLLRLISLAYSVPGDRVFGGPPWLDTDRFDVTAKAPSAASQIVLRKMLQGLLAERFNLSVQEQEKPVPVFALTLSRRGVQKESSGTGEPECKSGNEENIRTFACQHMTIQGLAERLVGVAPGYFNLPVVDRTGLKGAYDFGSAICPADNFHRAPKAPRTRSSTPSKSNSASKWRTRLSRCRS
jgi:uncharacterized protein (TIGR03435 family)